MNNLLQLLKSGASMRYRPPHGFYTVMSGKSTPLSEATGRAAHAMQPMHRDSKALPARPASVPPALPDVHPLRRTLHSEIPAPVPADSRTAPGQVQGGATAVGCAGAQRDGAASAGKGDGVGCGACAGKGVTA